MSAVVTAASDAGDHFGLRSLSMTMARVPSTNSWLREHAHDVRYSWRSTSSNVSSLAARRMASNATQREIGERVAIRLAASLAGPASWPRSAATMSATVSPAKHSSIQLR